MNTEKQSNRSIKTKDQAEILSNSETKPSEVTDSFWVYAKRKKGEYPKSTPRSGKWLIFVNLKNVNEVWAKIKKAVEEGRLGDCAKVATAKKKLLYENSNVKVICVYTYDWADEKDVRRIREELKN